MQVSMRNKVKIAMERTSSEVHGHTHRCSSSGRSSLSELTAWQTQARKVLSCSLPQNKSSKSFAST